MGCTSATLSTLAHAVQDVAMHLSGEQALERPPEPARAQVAAVARGENDFRPARGRPDFVRASAHRHAAFDAEPLLDDVETDGVRRIGESDGLDDVPALVRAAH